MKKILSALMVAFALAVSTAVPASAAPARKTEALVLHAIRGTVKHTDITKNASTAVIDVGGIPAGAFVVGSVVVVKTAFTSAATPSLSVGKAGAEEEVMAAATFVGTSTGRKLGTLSPIPAADTTYSVFASATDYTKLTEGEAEVIIYYYPHAK